MALEVGDFCPKSTCRKRLTTESVQQGVCCECATLFERLEKIASGQRRAASHVPKGGLNELWANR